jgi:hypothetical protein
MDFTPLLLVGALGVGAYAWSQSGTTPTASATPPTCAIAPDASGPGTLPATITSANLPSLQAQGVQLTASQQQQLSQCGTTALNHAQLLQLAGFASQPIAAASVGIAPLAPGLTGYGYQWRVSEAVCEADAIEAGDIPRNCPPTFWFWILALGVGAVALFAPKKGGSR